MVDLLRGVYPAAVTPMDAVGHIDWPGLVRLVSFFRSQSAAGIVLAGTNGEGPSLSAVEKRDLVRQVVPIAEDLAVILGVATASLEEAVWSCESARKAGASAALVMAPAYFREASLDAIEAWFTELTSRTELPILVYNFPQRTGITLTPESIQRLMRLDGVIGLKDSSGDPSNVSAYAEASNGKKLYTGDETLLVKCLDAGWTGTISGAANVLCRWLAAILAEWDSDNQSARAKHELIHPAIAALRNPDQPGVNKELLFRMGILPSPDLRLPLRTPNKKAADQAWSAAGKWVVPTA